MSRIHVRKPGFIDIAIAIASVDRGEEILQRVAGAACVQGFQLIATDKSAAFTDGDVTIPFRLKEEVRRTKHEPTADELAKDEKERKRREALWSRNGWGAAPSGGILRSWPEWDYAPSGMLAFELDVHIRHTSDLQRAFRDGKKQRLENLANKIGTAMAVIAAAKREDRRRDEEQRLKWADEERRRNEAKRRAYIEERRLKALDELLTRFERRDQLRLLASQVSGRASSDHAPRSAEFARWLEEKLAQAERSTTVTALEEMFRTERIFGEDDDSGINPSRRW